MIARHNSRIKPCVVCGGSSFSDLTLGAAADANICSATIIKGNGERAYRVARFDEERDQRHGDYMHRMSAVTKEKPRRCVENTYRVGPTWWKMDCGPGWWLEVDVSKWGREESWF
jgi:hypothetical protein